MERKINKEFLKWKRDSINKPFFLYGPRQVGKTYSVLEFGQTNYKNVAYFNMQENPELQNALEKEKVLERLIMKLSLICGESIFKGDTLLVFDNCNKSELMKKLKIFANTDYQVIMISSNREEVNKVRVEEFFYRSMFPLDFEEYLQNTDKVQLIDFIRDSYHNNTPMPFHQMAMDAYFDYLITGGFPEVVKAKLEGNSDLYLETLKQKIMDLYQAEYHKYTVSYTRCEEIMNSLPLQLNKENKKFQYGLIKKGGRSKNYESSINTLTNNGVINRSYRLIDVKSPLSSDRDLESFKIYYNDVGLLYTMLHLNKTKFLTSEELRRTLVENNIANTLVSLGYNLYYYQSEGKAEVSFIVQNRIGKIIPIELVNMKLTKAKSLTLFLTKYKLDDSIRLTEDNFSKKKGMRYIPLYAAFCLKDL